MAIIKSPVWSEARGSIGGTTYARNKSGLYARNRSKPVNPNTVNQSTVRAQFGTNSYNFGQLDADSIAAWNQFAQGYPAINRVGDTYTPSGRQVFMLCNQNLLSIGETAITIPPYDTPVVPNIVGDITPPTFHVLGPGAGPLTLATFDLPKSDLDTAIVVFQATPPMQAARQSYRNRMRQIGFDTNNATVAGLTPYNAYFGTPTAAPGQIVNARFSAVDPASGVASAWFYTQALVVAAP